MVWFGVDFFGRVSTLSFEDPYLCVYVCGCCRYSTDMSTVRCLPMAYQNIHFHAHSHDGGLMRASHHCCQGMTLILVSASDSPRSKGFVVVSTSLKDRNIVLWTLVRDPRERFCKTAWRCGAGGSSKTDAGHRDFGPPTRAALAACQKRLPFRSCQGEASWLICGVISNFP
ncbi:hypothetical protein LY78DRAFT_4792 [Colletotrichum sublineola]|nr:hypothetical protein LY78DRAFT_4792 [Colletotrichum sublineola]